MNVRLLDLSTLRPHEHVHAENVRILAEHLADEEVVRQPLLVAEGSLVILDGHHRFKALKTVLKARRAPCVLVDYHDHALVSLEAWRADQPVDRSMVVAAAMTGRLLPAKSTRHRVRVEMGSVEVPLSALGCRPDLNVMSVSGGIRTHAQLQLSRGLP